MKTLKGKHYLLQEEVVESVVRSHCALQQMVAMSLLRRKPQSHIRNFPVPFILSQKK